MEQQSKMKVESFETTFIWTIQDFCILAKAEWNQNYFFISKKFSFDNIDVSGIIKLYPQQGNPDQWLFHFFLDDAVYSGENSQLNIELPFKTWVKQPYDGGDLIIMAEAKMFSDLCDQSGTLQFPFKMTYKIATFEKSSVEDEESQSIETRVGVFDDIDSSDSTDSESVSSAPADFEDFVMHGSPFKVHEHLIVENHGLKKENDVLKKVINYLESEINLFKFRENIFEQWCSVFDSLENENANLKAMNFGLQDELKEVKVQQKQQEKSIHSLEMEQINLQANIQTLESEMKKFEKRCLSDKKIIEELTLKCINSDLESEMVKPKQHGQLIPRIQQLEEEKKNMTCIVFNQSYEIGVLKGLIMSERMKSQNFKINMREIGNCFEVFNNISRVTIGHV